LWKMCVAHHPGMHGANRTTSAMTWRYVMKTIGGRWNVSKISDGCSYFNILIFMEIHTNYKLRWFFSFVRLWPSIFSNLEFGGVWSAFDKVWLSSEQAKILDKLYRSSNMREIIIILQCMLFFSVVSVHEMEISFEIFFPIRFFCKLV
jgi:hypothetical protein